MIARLLRHFLSENRRGGVRHRISDVELDRVDPDAPGAREVWQRYRTSWGRWNALRTFVCMLAAAGFILVR